MLRKFKIWLIYHLGGCPVEELQKTDRNSYQVGVYSALISLRIFADKMNGVPAEEWCKRMYNHLSKSISQMEQTSTEKETN